MATYLLDGHKKSIDIEDIAMKAHEISPGRFSWRKYPNQINLKLVSLRLEFAANTKDSSSNKSQQHQNFVTGSTKTGWSLTTEGYEWAKKNENFILKSNLTPNSGAKKSGSIDSVRRDRELARIKNSAAWAYWSSGEKNLIGKKEVDEVLRTDSYSTGRITAVKINRLKETFDEENELKDFLNLIFKIKNKQ
jgi:hypothetical protein